jgi:ABC-type Fe3+/spermidine/putrescine transport system ATPase subunit
MLLDVSHVSKTFPGLPVLHDISFTVDEAEIVCLLGPSGCGKTTLLRIIAGLETPDEGALAFAGQDLAQLPVHRRNFGLMFQDFALFPHKDVEANVAFGLRMHNWSSTEISRRVREMLQLVELGGYERRRVSELSGGEQQRVALARSLAPRPRLLMFDEPLGSLDRSLREQLMNSLRGILKQVGVTAVYVTHDQEEAFAIADRVFIMRPGAAGGEGGRIVQGGTPEEVYCQPQSKYVARFLGFRNLLAGTVVASDETPREPGLNANRLDRAGKSCGAGDEMVAVETLLGQLAAGNIASAVAAGDQVTLLIRPEAATIVPDEPPRGAGIHSEQTPASRHAHTPPSNLVSGRLLSSSFRGSSYLIRTEHPGDVVLISEVPAAGLDMPPPGSTVCLHLNPHAISLLR